MAWALWISMWSSLPVIALAFAGAVMDLFPPMHNRPMAAVLTLAAIWAVVLVNLRGVKEAGLFSQVTTYTKLVPFAAVALIGLFFIDTSNLSEFNPSGNSLLGSMAALAPVTMFAFLGLEFGDDSRWRRDRSETYHSALDRSWHNSCRAALRVRHSSCNGISAARAARPVGVTVFRCGTCDLGRLGSGNNFPRNHALRHWRTQRWTLLMGQVPMAAARDDLFPPIFGRISSQGVPAIGIIISAIFATLLVLSQVAGPPGFKAYTIRRWPQHHGSCYSLCILRAGDRASRGLCGGRRTCAAIGADRGDRLLLFRIHSLWVWSEASPLRHDHARARHTGLRWQRRRSATA